MFSLHTEIDFIFAIKNIQGKHMTIKKLAAVAALVGSSSLVSAQELEITITNLTHGIYYTPFIVAAHDGTTSFFRSGTPASPELQQMAEGGNIAGLETIFTAANANITSNPAGGLLAPARSTTFTMSTDDGNNYLSVGAMLLPTNDGFAGLNNWRIPSEPGTYRVNVNAYDAGTEANDEIVGSGAPGEPGFPNPPPVGVVATGGTGVTTIETNTNVHIHRGNLGDDDPTGGKSDITNYVHRWLNPVVRVTVKVM